jgi:hypothetical protein
MSHRTPPSIVVRDPGRSRGRKSAIDQWMTNIAHVDPQPVVTVFGQFSTQNDGAQAIGSDFAPMPGLVIQ